MNQSQEQTRRAARDQRERISRLFSSNKEVRSEAQELLKAAWSFDEPAFSVEELASVATESCTLMAARRDAHKEVITWLIKLSNRTTENHE